VILGGGPNRIGQGIEFDYCCCHACYALDEAGYETIMVNCNPETVSTDYDTSDRLYFEPLTEEHVLEILRKEQENGTLRGVIVQFGGQTPLKLARALEAAGIPILGTTPDAIDLAEDRERFQKLLHDLNLRQPRNGIARSREEALAIAGEIGFPLVIRPSYVLGGRAMEIVRDEAHLERYIREAVVVSGTSPGAARRLSLRRRGSGCRRALRRRGGAHRRRHGAYRGSRRAFGRQRLRAAPRTPSRARPSPSWSARPPRWRRRSAWSG
jgi:carbamoyl-phosphate synthase large subunit